MTRVSVIIPTTGRPSLPATLEALAAQDQPPSFEIVIAVDGAPAPDIRGVAVHPKCTRIHVISSSSRQGVSVARNAAVKQAEGDLLGFLDDDVLPHPSWMRALAEHLDKSDAVTGRILEDDSQGTLAKLRKLAFDHRHETNLATGAAVDYVNGGNFAIRSLCMRRIGDFNPRFIKSQDRELARRMVRAGLVLDYGPDMLIRHKGEYTTLGLIRGRYKAGRAAATMSHDGDCTSVGPMTAKQTYGADVVALALRHGPMLGAAAALSSLAHRAGRRRPFPRDRHQPSTAPPNSTSRNVRGWPG
jgi:glycosyltransferase involved in cell wall biosynthesis